MKLIHFTISLLFFSLGFISCSEETLTKQTVVDNFKPNDVNAFSMNTCANMQFDKPPVDILFVVDNTGSTNHSGFDKLKNQIANTITNISRDFDYHLYVAPLLPIGSESLQSYPLIISNPTPFTNLAELNVTNIENLQIFSAPTGNNSENGLNRVLNLISSNRDNGIFREMANTVIVLISDGDDTTLYNNVVGNLVFDPQKFLDKKNEFIALKNSLKAESFRFFSLVAQQNCQGFRIGSQYRRMSQELYDYFQLSDDNVQKNSYDLCSGNYTQVFSTVNSSIKAVVVGHEYDHWKISDMAESSIQLDQIEIFKVLANGNQVLIPEDDENGYRYLGAKENFEIRSRPTRGEAVSGLIVKLNGDAQVKYPECIISKTQSPNEYFGYIVINREPELESIRVKIRGAEIPQSTTNGWSYIGYHETKNLKVPGPTSAPVVPEINRSGYFIKLNGNALFSNGDETEVLYLPKAL
jgi:hypothetical protein